MTDSEDKRNEMRISCKIPVPVFISYFNSKYAIKAQLVDHCINGIGFICDHAFLEGASIIFKVDYCPSKNLSYSDLEKLPSIRLGEVKWCRKYPSESSPLFGVGVKYYPQIY